MAFWNRSRPAQARVERRDTLDVDPGWMGLAQLSGMAGGTSPRFAENLATAVACVNAVSSGLAALPATVYRAQDDGRVEAPGHAVSRLIRQPNPHQTWPDWIEFSVAQLLLRGNTVSVVERDGAGRPTALTPVPWEWVQVQVLPSGRLRYDVTMTAAPWGGQALTRSYLESEVLHVRDRMDNPYIGRSRISRAPAVLEAALGLQTYSTSVWHNGASPSGVLTLPPGISREGKERAEEYFTERMAGAANAKRILFADKDSAFTPISVSPEDAEVLASRKFSVTEICRLFNVPPPIVQDYSNNTFTNAAQASLWFATNTLAPLARKVEAEFSRSVFTDSAYHLELDLSGLVRGDYATRWQANVAAVGAGILTADEIREQEGYGPLPAGSAEPPGEPGEA
jgi:HK97 family phage portal protein